MLTVVSEHLSELNWIAQIRELDVMQHDVCHWIRCRNAELGSESTWLRCWQEYAKLPAKLTLIALQNQPNTIELPPNSADAFKSGRTIQILTTAFGSAGKCSVWTTRGLDGCDFQNIRACASRSVVDNGMLRLTWHLHAFMLCGCGCASPCILFETELMPLVR